MSSIEAVIFDWAGTMIDFGSRAPMGVFVELFHRQGLEVSVLEARVPMGLPKRAHIAAMLAQPRIADAWAAQYGATATEADIDRLYAEFGPMNVAIAAQFADLVPGALPIIERLKADGVRIGSTTGYTRAIMEQVVPVAAAQGYAPETLVCADDLPEGRPGPMMMQKCFADLDLADPARVVKVDDTEPGIAEGLAAGTWTVGVAVSGNAVGLSAAEWAALSPNAQFALRRQATQRLFEVGAHFVVDTVTDLLPVLDTIRGKLAAGQTPTA